MFSMLIHLSWASLLVVVSKMARFYSGRLEGSLLIELVFSNQLWCLRSCITAKHGILTPHLPFARYHSMSLISESSPFPLR